MMNKIRQQLLKSGNIRPAGVQAAAHDTIEKAKRPVKAVRGNDVTEAKRRKALAFLQRGLYEAV